ncbi:MAG: PAS domain-containing protein [Phycisphaerales bacterium]|nr:PAS domain-containing protein [Hyphomonadaceae bacterium]
MTQDSKTSADDADIGVLLNSLRLSEARLRGVLYSISDGFYAVDRNWRFTEFNPAAEAYFRIRREDIIGRVIWEMIPGASEEFKQLLRAAMDGAPMATLEAQSLYRPDRFVELRIAATEEGLCVALTDITERKLAHQRLEAAVAERTAALAASETRLRTILETTNLFIGLIAPDGAVLDANAASLGGMGRDKADVIGMKYWDTPWFTATPGMSEAVREAVEQVAAGAIVTRTIALNLPDGVRSFDFCIRPVKDETGAVIAIVPEASEITARLKAEEHLRQAQKLEAVGQLTGGIAHDFNNLLMVIAGGLNMLDRSGDQSRREMLMSRMRDAVDRGANLTRQLLAFSRRHQLNPEPIRISDYLSGLNDLLGRSLGVNVRVAIDTPTDVAPVFTDRNALQLAILNLAVNARDAMNDKGVVTIRARDGAPDDPAAAFVSISVIDSGAGMTPDVLARIFEPFFTTKEIGKGSGLGLAQVHGFAEQSGGRIDVVTTPGQGTSMTLVLPRAEIDPAHVEQQLAPDNPTRAHEPKGAVLLVEDDDEVAAVTGEMLEHLGWRVTRVASAEAALGALGREAAFNLIFSDVMMPGGQNGIELARRVRARPSAPPIVLTSGYAESVRSEAERAGVALLPKPFDIDALAAALDGARAISA